MNCSLLTPRVLRWLQNDRPARIINLFDEVCNLADDTGDVISLVSDRNGVGPFSMLIDGDFRAHITAGMPISVDPDACSLTVGSLTIKTDRATVWNPKPAWQMLNIESELRFVIPPLTDKAIAEPLQQLIQGIVHFDTAECRSGAFRLAGLGNGLTPAGDDILMGVLYGLWVWHPDVELMRLIVETAVPRTTTLSAAFLKAARFGEATIHWHNLVSGRTNALNQILSIGSTSGRDAWTGFVHLGRKFSN